MESLRALGEALEALQRRAEAAEAEAEAWKQRYAAAARRETTGETRRRQTTAPSPAIPIDCGNSDDDNICVDDPGHGSVGAAAASAVAMLGARVWMTNGGSPRSSFNALDGALQPQPPRAGSPPSDASGRGKARFRLLCTSRSAETIAPPPLESPAKMDANAITRKNTQSLETSAGRSHDKKHVLSLSWLTPVSRVLVIAKPGDEQHQALERCASFLLEKGVVVYVEPKVHAKVTESAAVTDPSRVLTWPAPDDADDGEPDDLRGQIPVPIPRELVEVLDLAVTLGGDGTVLWTSRLVGTAPCPPIVPFQFGSLGFLAVYGRAEMLPTIERVLDGGFQLTLRHRLDCQIVRANETGLASHHAVLNEVVIDRGPSPFLTNLSCWVGDVYMTSVEGDGVLVSSPTGSTAYNLAAGGSMVHPAVPGILFTPICPHSLSFRPLVLPDTVTLKVSVPADARGAAYASFDGKEREVLAPGDALYVRVSPHPIPTVVNPRDDSWFSHIRNALQWNERRVQQGAL